MLNRIGLVRDDIESLLVSGAGPIDISGIDAAIDSAGKTATRNAIIQLLGKRGVLACVGHGELAA